MQFCNFRSEYESEIGEGTYAKHSIAVIQGREVIMTGMQA